MRLALILLCLEDRVGCGKNPLDFITSIKWLYQAKDFLCFLVNICLSCREEGWQLHFVYLHKAIITIQGLRRIGAFLDYVKKWSGEKMKLLNIVTFLKDVNKEDLFTSTTKNTNKISK